MLCSFIYAAISTINEGPLVEGLFDTWARKRPEEFMFNPEATGMVWYDFKVERFSGLKDDYQILYTDISNCIE